MSHHWRFYVVHVLNELQRGSKSTQVIDDRQTSSMVRDRYINELGYYNKIGVGRKKDGSEKEVSVVQQKLKML